MKFCVVTVECGGWWVIDLFGMVSLAIFWTIVDELFYLIMHSGALKDATDAPTTALVSCSLNHSGLDQSRAERGRWRTNQTEELKGWVSSLEFKDPEFVAFFILAMFALLLRPAFSPLLALPLDIHPPSPIITTLQTLFADAPLPRTLEDV